MLAFSPSAKICRERRPSLCRNEYGGRIFYSFCLTNVRKTCFPPSALPHQLLMRCDSNTSRSTEECCNDRSSTTAAAALEAAATAVVAAAAARVATAAATAAIAAAAAAAAVKGGFFAWRFLDRLLPLR
ncbi:hypothetical protein Esti_000106 [Eimeria stiedai]